MNRYRIGFSLGIALLLAGHVHAQRSGSQQREQIIEQRIELIAESLEAEEIDFTTLFDELNTFYEHPINLNRTTQDELERLRLLSDFQILSLMDHIDQTGKLVNIYELQAIRGFDRESIRLILPFVKVSEASSNARITLSDLRKDGDHMLMLRYIRLLEEVEGASPIEDSLLAENPNRRFLGSEDRLYARYRFTYLNRISVGFTAEKDAGEEFFSGTQSGGFDFYSGHVFVRDFGFVKQLALGDYQIQLGQGLTFWSGLGFGKSSDVLNIKRNAPVIKPYTSVDENRFLRGGATTVGWKNWELTGFYSNRQIDANIIEADTNENEPALVVSSFQSSGLHRTPGEVLDKDAIEETNYGMHLAYNTRRLTVGATAIRSE
ncbi:MAG: hypothetical protein AAGB22_12345, partial [Bacteroidota bacterium]